MARIRTVKPEFWTNEQVMECSTTARLLFIGMWNFCDDGGNHPASAKTLKAEIFPADDISAERVQGLLDELIDNDLLLPYESAGKKYLHVTGWHHQKIEKKNFKHPMPEIQRPIAEEWTDDTPAIDTTDSVDRQPVADDSTTDRRPIDDLSTTEGKGREGSKPKPPIPPLQGGDSPVEKLVAKRSAAVTLKTFLDQCRQTGEKPIPESDKVFDFADEVGIPHDWLRLVWLEFKVRYDSGQKRYKDWRQVFRNAVRGNWFKVWFVGEQGIQLSSQGRILLNAHREAA